MKLAVTRALRRAAHFPNPGSSLLNPRSQRAKLRGAAAAHQAQSERFEQQALFADIGGTADRDPSQRKGSKRPSPVPRSKRQRSTKHLYMVGEQVAERAKYMTDSEWESVPLEDKHAFARHMSRLLREHPTQATEHQRRRYFETTMADPRDLDPGRTVRDEYERVKLGLPVQLKNPQRSLGVSQALYEAGDASLFDAENVHKLENAMTHMKQVFADYVRKKREGVSTEAERRQLANMTADLNVETQRHLASMFKYAEEKLRAHAMDERARQLSELERIKRMSVKSTGAADRSRRSTTRAQRKARLKHSISKAIGLDVDVVDSLLSELQAQEQFLQFCEVFARLTLGRGFEHGPGDEGLDAYTESLKRLYSADASALSTLDVVQYLASKDGAQPVEWAQRWYERALLLPLSRTPEYQRLQEIQRSDARALAQRAQLRNESEVEANVVDGDAVAREAEGVAARMREEKVVRIVEKMYLRPDDARLKTVHERRLRYIAYLQMERQIRQARQNARLFAGVELTTEAEECRALYQQLLERRAVLSQESRGELHADGGSSQDPSVFSTSNATAAAATGTVDLYGDAQADALFEKIRDITIAVIRERRAESKATAKARKVARVVDAVKGSGDDSVREIRALLEERKQRLSQRLLGIVEKDVRSEMQWLEAMEEAERPPLLPIPEGMSYVSAGDVQAWTELREHETKNAGNPFMRAGAARQKSSPLQASFLGQSLRIPDKPMLFWGTGTKAVQQALQHAAQDADRQRRGEPLAPPYPCAENPWGWRLARDILDE